MNVEIIPNEEEEEEEVVATESHQQPHHEGTTTTATATIIENIDSILPNNAPSTAHTTTTNDNIDDEDISAAISDDTSATSLASTLSDGISRPRSASLHTTTTTLSSPSSSSGPNNDGRPSSIPRIRPRSNPRTRTPMRQASPLLVISPIVASTTITTANQLSSGGANNNNNEENEQLIRNIFHTNSSRGRRSDGAVRRPRASSIPEEMVHDVPAHEGDDVVVTPVIAPVDDNNDTDGDGVAAAVSVDINQVIPQVDNAHNDIAPPSQSSTNTTTTTTRTAGRFFTQAVTSTTTTQRRRNNNHNHHTTNESNTHHHQRTLSTKQNPSHRKIRRWKNDAFIGTPSEHVHTMLLMGGGGGDSNNNNSNNDKRWNTFPYMPNHPLEYTSEFQKLSRDTTKGGERVRERFVRGEVADVDVAWRRNGGEGEDEEGLLGEEERMYQRIVTKCHQMGISSKQQVQQLMKDETVEWGKVLYNKLGMRIQSVLSRSCSSVDTTSANSGIVGSFESYLVSLALHSGSSSNHNMNDDVDVGFPPLQSQVVYDVFNVILARPPRIVIRNKQQQSSSSSFNKYNKQRNGKVPATAKEVSDLNQYGVLIPTIHFYFPTDEGQGGSSKRSSAFHRILLYAVCQFHGLETSSSFVVPEKKKKVKKADNDGRRRGRQKQTRDVSGSMKVVTVQGGVLLAPSVKLLDFVCTC